MSAALVDLEALRAEFEGDEDILLEALNHFEETFNASLDAMESLTQQDYTDQVREDLAKMIHTFRGEVANFRCQSVVDSLRSWETGLSDSQTLKFEKLADIRRELLAVVEEIRQNFKPES